MAKQPPQSKAAGGGIDALLATLSVDELHALYREYRDDHSPEGERRFHQIKSRLARLPHEQVHPGEEYIDCTIPLSVTGHPYTINGRPVFGKVRLPKCEYDQIKHMEYHGHRVEAERMQDTGRLRDLGNVGRTAQLIQSDG